MRFVDGYPLVRIDFCGDVIDVADDAAAEERACDLKVRGRLGDVSALIVAPLAGGLPKRRAGTRRGSRRLSGGALRSTQHLSSPRVRRDRLAHSVEAGRQRRTEDARAEASLPAHGVVAVGRPVRQEANELVGYREVPM